MLSKSAWRPWLLALCALAFILIDAQFVWQLEGGSFGLSGTPTQSNGLDRLRVRSESAAAQSGIETGDLLDTLALTPAARFRLWSGARVGEAVVLSVVHLGVA